MAELDKYLDGIKREGRAGWIKYYKALLNRPISSPDRFWVAIEQYGELHIFEAVMLTSTRKITGDPLAYILSIAHRRWRETVESDEAQVRYARDLEIGKEMTATRNAELARKLQRARELDE